MKKIIIALTLMGFLIGMASGATIKSHPSKHHKKHKHKTHIVQKHHKHKKHLSK